HRVSFVSYESMPSSTAAVAQAPPPPPARAATRAPRSRGNVAALTAEQFQRAYEVATLAADKELWSLSLRAIRLAARGGPPIPVNKPRDGGPLTSKTINGIQYLVSSDGNTPIGVDQALVSLVPRWQAAKVPANEIYELLAAAVLPEARPA